MSAFLDALEARGYGERFVLAGLCAGGFWAFNAADRDPRAVAALMVNPGALEWHPELVKDRNARKLQRLRRRVWWRRVFRGQVKRKNVVAVARATVSQGWHDIASAPRRLTGRGDRPDAVAISVERILDRLRDRDVRVVMAFSDEEPVHAELERDGVLANLDRWPNLEMGVLPARDHTLRPIVAQVAVHELLDRELTRELHQVADAAPAGPPLAPRSTARPARPAGRGLMRRGSDYLSAIAGDGRMVMLDGEPVGRRHDPPGFLRSGPGDRQALRRRGSVASTWRPRTAAGPIAPCGSCPGRSTTSPPDDACTATGPRAASG